MELYISFGDDSSFYSIYIKLVDTLYFTSLIINYFSQTPFLVLFTNILLLALTSFELCLFLKLQLYNR